MAEIRRRSRADRRVLREGAPGIERRVPGVREFELQVERKSDSHVILHMTHEFVAQNYYLLDETLERLSPYRPGMRIELELSRVPYADSEALGRILPWAKKLSQAGASLVVVNPSPYVTSIMDVLKLDQVLAVVHRHMLPPSEN